MSKDSVTYRKSREFASRIVKMYSYLKDTKWEFVMSKQARRSGTGIGANWAEVLCAISKPEFVNKVSIAHKEVHETRYWLGLPGENGFLSQKDFCSISKDFNEIISLSVATLKTACTRIQSEK